MKKIIAIAVLIVCAGIYFVIQKNKPEHNSADYTIGIVQTASHPALDAVLDGFRLELQSLMGDKTVAFVVQNAQGSVSAAHTIAQQFHGSKKYDLFFAIATPAAQAMHAVEKERPIIIAAVTDPKALELVYPMSNVSGVTDMIDVQAQVAMLTKLIPDAKKIGLLYTVGETNSVILVELLKQDLMKVGLIPSDFAVSCESDMQAVVELACRKSDLILAPTDNVVASTISLITMIVNKYKKPFIVSDNMLVSAGALAAQGVDYKVSGQQAAQIAFQLLTEGAKVLDMPIEQTKCEQIFVNQQTLELLGLSIPVDLKNEVVLIS